MARKNKRNRVPTVGRILPLVSIRNRVYRELEQMAHRLAPVRALAWRLYRSRAALGRSHEAIRDADWMDRPDPETGEAIAGRAAQLGVPARVWKAYEETPIAAPRQSRPK
jgi:hypothetical protein